MKLSTRQLFLSAAIACFFAVALITFAQPTPPPAPPPAPEKTPSSPAPTTKDSDDDEDDDKPAPAATPAPEAEKPAAATSTSTASPSTPLRRLDADTAVPAKAHAPKKRSRHSDNSVVNIGGNSYLAKGQTADAVVAIIGNAINDGEVTDSVVAVLGNATTTGPVADSVVAVLGNAKIDSTVKDTVVVVGGSIELGPHADVNDVVAVGGHIKRDPNAIVRGQTNTSSFNFSGAGLEGLQVWFQECAMSFRLLAFKPALMWAWWIALGFLGLYLLLAAMFGRTVDACRETFEQHPWYSLLSALLTILAAPVAFILLLCTGVGIPVIPFLALAVFAAGIFGKAVMFAWLGRRLAVIAGLRHPVLDVLIGGVIALLLYTIPVVGLIVYKVFGWVGLGIVVYSLLCKMRREKPLANPPAPTYVPAPSVAPSPEAGVPPAPVYFPAPSVGDPSASSIPEAVVTPVASTSTLPPPSAPRLPPLVSASTLPRAGFWIRLGALLIDVILVGVVMSALGGVIRSVLGRGHGGSQGELVLLAVYAACMWAARGTTIGGIVCGLKVVRLDDRRVDASTAIVRALGCFLSLVVCGLGFIWVVFDDQKQGWHDKIAGTTVVRVPKGVSLV